jgi:hypothetical protein
MKYTLLLVLTLLPLLSHAGPSRNNCNYYLDVERAYKCGAEGYPLKFGNRLCRKYLAAQSDMPARVQTWFPKIRYCLQNFIEKQHGSIRDCSDLHRKAIDSHIGCYVATGFCNLSLIDQASILKVTSTDLFNPDIVALSFRVKAACLSRY